MNIECGNCKTDFEAKIIEPIPLFNEARRYAWVHVNCPNCNKQIDIARFNKQGRILAISG